MLSSNPQALAPKEGIGENELQVAVLSSEPITSIDVLLQAEPYHWWGHQLHSGRSNGRIPN